MKLIVWLTLTALLLLTIPAQSADYLSLKFSKKNQIRTGLVWIQFKPRLVDVKHMSIPATHFASLPAAAMGKLFFTTEAGKVASCSGFFAEERDVVVTAADCVMTIEGEWNADFLFIQAYGSTAQEVYAIQCVAVPRPWGELNGDAQRRYDYAFLHTNRISKSETLELTEENPPEVLTLLGYPDRYAKQRKVIPEEMKVVHVEAAKIGSDYPRKYHSSGAAWLANERVYSLSAQYLPVQKRQPVWGPRFNHVDNAVDYVSRGCKK